MGANQSASWTEEVIHSNFDNLLECINNHDTTSFKNILKSVPNEETKKKLLDVRAPETGYTLLNYAIVHNKTDIALILIEEKNINHIGASDMRSYNPFHHSITQNNFTCFKALLNKSGSFLLLTSNGNGETALHMSAQLLRKQMFLALLEYSNDSDEMSRESNIVDSPLVILMKHYPTKDLQSTMTSLEYDERVKDVSIMVEKLLSKELNVFATEKSTKNASLAIACDRDIPMKILRLLLSKMKGNANVTNTSGATPLHIAIHNHQFTTAAEILSFCGKNLVVDVRDKDGNSPLITACQISGLNDDQQQLSLWEDIVRDIVKLSSDPQQLIFWKNREGKMAIDYCVEDEKRNIMEFLKKKMSEERCSYESRFRGVSFQICSDIHTEFYRGEVPDDMINPSAPILCLLGDIGVVTLPSYREFILEQSKKFERVFVVTGNHEYYGAIVEEAQKTVDAICEEAQNAVFLNKRSVVINGVRFVGCTLWSFVPDDHKDLVQVCLNDYRRIKMGEKTPFLVHDSVKIHLDEVEYIKKEIMLAKDQKETVVILTHHAPVKDLGSSEATHYHQPLNTAFTSDLRHLLGDNVAVWAYGHTHWFHDMTINGSRVVSNPKGYPTEKSVYDNSFVINV